MGAAAPSSIQSVVEQFFFKVCWWIIPEPLCACLLSVVNWNKRTRGSGSQVVAREMPAGHKKEFSFVKMVVHPNRMPEEALASPSPNLPGRAFSLLTGRSFRVMLWAEG